MAYKLVLYNSIDKLSLALKVTHKVYEINIVIKNMTSHRHNWAVGLSQQITWQGLGLLHSDYDASTFSCQAILQRSKCFSLTRTFIHTSLSLSDKTKSFLML